MALSFSQKMMHKLSIIKMNKKMAVKTEQTTEQRETRDPSVTQLTLHFS